MASLNSEDDLVYLLDTIQDICLTVNKSMESDPGVVEIKTVTKFLASVEDSVSELIKSALIDVELR
jgi:hypothetical protein